MLTNTTEIGTARLPLRRVTIPALTAVSPSAPRRPSRFPALARAVLAGVLALAALAAPAAAQTEPGAPRYLEIVPGDRKVTLQWKPPASDGGAPITGYEYRYKSTGNNYPAAWTAVPDESLTVGHGLHALHIHPNLMNGTEYTFQVHAVNSEGSGMPSNEATTTPIPNMPHTIPDKSEGVIVAQSPRVGERVKIVALHSVEDQDDMFLARGGEERYTYKWQWLRVNAGVETEIPGATELRGILSTVYILTPADVGSQVKARMRFLDDRGNLEEWVSALYPTSGTIAAAGRSEPPGDSGDDGGRDTDPPGDDGGGGGTDPPGDGDDGGGGGGDGGTGEPPPEPVPALPVAGAIGLGLLLLGTGARALRGRA